jgi:hypothetical protein
MIYQSVTSDIIPGKMAEYDEIAARSFYLYWQSTRLSWSEPGIVILVI